MSFRRLPNSATKSLISSLALFIFKNLESRRDGFAEMITNRDVDQHGCILELTPSRLNDISMEQFLTIPQCLALDFEDLEANRPNLNCQNCGSEDSLELMVANRTYQVLCNQCFSDIKAAAPEGRLRYTEPVRWGAAIATLLSGMVLFVMVWGLLQQPSFDLRDGRLLLVVPFMSSVFLVGSVAKAARGHSVCLRLATVFAIIAATLAGNIWGLHSYALAQQIPITWGEAVELYFQHQLPNDSDREIFYLLGGAAGAWLGISMLKSTGFMRIE